MLLIKSHDKLRQMVFSLGTRDRSEAGCERTDSSRTVYFKKETNNGETNNVEMLCCNHKVHHFKTSRILNNSSKKHLKH